MGEYDYALCLFCLSGKEKEVVESIHQMGFGRALFPQKVKHFRDKREWEEVLVPMVPGYVFVYLHEDEKECYYKLAGIPEVVRVLGYDKKSIGWLVGSDLVFAELIWKRNGILGDVLTAQVGDRVEIVDSDLEQLQGRITKVDRRKRMVQVHTDGAGIINNVWLPYHMVEKRDA